MADDLAASMAGGENPMVTKQDPNCPVFASVVPNALTPAVLHQATYAFTPATINRQAKWKDWTVTFDQKPQNGDKVQIFKQ